MISAFGNHDDLRRVPAGRRRGELLRRLLGGDDDRRRLPCQPPKPSLMPPAAAGRKRLREPPPSEIVHHGGEQRLAGLCRGVPSDDPLEGRYRHRRRVHHVGPSSLGSHAEEPEAPQAGQQLGGKRRAGCLNGQSGAELLGDAA